jgi:hypothetical protein
MRAYYGQNEEPIAGRKPIEADVCQKRILGENRIQVATAIGPRAKFLDNPCGEACRRISERERKGLGSRPLNPLVAGLVI